MGSADITGKGLVHDRRWMLVDQNNQFITQRNVHPLALFKLTSGRENFEVRFENDFVKVPFEADGKKMKAQIWEDEVEVVEPDQVLSQWFSDHLKINCKLVFFPEVNARRLDPNYVPEERHVGLADGYPFLIIGQSSIDDLNSRLETPVPMNRFRPNFVFTGGSPYEEDRWRNFRIGDNRFVGVKQCARCVLTTVDQQTATKGREPLLTLSRYRKDGEKILFGQNLIALDHGQVHIGDHITVETFTE